MPAFDVSRSIRIDASPAAVFADVRDFRNWPDWSPWLICDPHAKLSYADDGKRYDWEGPLCGSGFMEVSGESDASSIDYSLTFLSPWKSTNKVGLRINGEDGGTEATWTMTGSLPWFMFWMKSMMSGYIGADYDRGLRMLKDRIETGTVPSKLEFPGIIELPETAYVGINTECPIDQIGPHMRENFGRIREWLEAADLSPSGPPFCSVLKWSPGANLCRYTACVPFLQAPDEGPAGFVSGTRPACRAYRVRHTGAYRHLGNAWAAGMMHARAKVFDGSKRLAPFETYDSDPETTPEDELVTTVHLPAK